MPKSIYRFSDLFVVFKGGESDLLNEIATMCVLYEDFRFEINHLKDAIRKNEIGKDQEAFYWIRRSVLTMNEIRERINVICRQLSSLRDTLTEESWSTLVNAQRFLNKSRLREVRNDFGGHLNPELIGSGVKFHGPNAISTISYLGNADDELALRLEFAADLFRGAFASRFAPDILDLAQQMRAFYEELSEANLHVVRATYVLTVEFVWRRFGR